MAGGAGYGGEGLGEAVAGSPKAGGSRLMAIDASHCKAGPYNCTDAKPVPGYVRLTKQRAEQVALQLRAMNIRAGTSEWWQGKGRRRTTGWMVVVCPTDVGVARHKLAEGRSGSSGS